MDIVSRVWKRYAQKLVALTTNPKQVEPHFKVLDHALHALMAGETKGEDLMQGEMFQNYSLAIDAYREIVYFLRKRGTPPLRAHALEMMSKHPFAPDQLSAHAFPMAFGEVVELRKLFDQQPSAGATI